VNGSCGPCGDVGQACCGGGTCTAANALCMGGRCQTCGVQNAPCCDGTCGPNLSCNGGPGGPVCVCGASLEPCCDGTTCEAGTCSAPNSDGVRYCL
jgi:hypothetical protein